MSATFVQPDAPVLSCPVVVYEGHDGPSQGPQVDALRDGRPADVVYTITKSENVLLDVDEKTLDCQGHVISEQIVTLPYRRYELAFYGLELDDKLTVDSVHLAPALGGPCPVLGPVIATENVRPADCGASPDVPPYTDSDPNTDENLSPYGNDMNCSVGGGGGSLIVALALLAVVGRRRR